MIIRQESRDDYDSIYHLVTTAFGGAAGAGDDSEQNLVATLRKSERYVPELALVAEEDGKVVGHIMLTRTYVTNGGPRFEGGLLLVPVAVMAEYRGRGGIGTELISTALRRATGMGGFKAVFLAGGDPEYYCRFGFVPTIRYGIRSSIDIPGEMVGHIMVCELVPGASTVSPASWNSVSSYAPLFPQKKFRRTLPPARRATGRSLRPPGRSPLPPPGPPARASGSSPPGRGRS
ncbi:GNAT family N-acetyltransferase [Methanoculleus chikugoensis]|uniref:GNAT family N-acetyltransferase n=1 Tax=Methanoculleus chikugoensis TaxID=118126 RepID=UPI0006D2026B|nr:N-acetyltransferase [Methanoculleus chikugoensis]